MTVPGVHTLAHAELGTRPSSVMRRPWRRTADRALPVPPPRGTPAVQGDARTPVRVRLGRFGWSLLLLAQVGASLAAGTVFLFATAEPRAAQIHEAPALVPLVSPPRHRRARRRPRRPTPATLPERPTMAAVLDAVGKQTDGAEACMRSAIGRGDLVGGRSYRFDLAWEIAPDGTVHDPRALAPAGRPGVRLTTCLAGAMAAWRFPSSQHGVTVRQFPFHFRVH